MLRVRISGHAEVVEVLLSRFEGIEVDPRNKLGITPLIKACVTGKRRCVQLLLDKGGLADQGICIPLNSGGECFIFSGIFMKW